MTRQPRQLTPRICESCWKDFGIEGPLPHGCVLTWEGDRMRFACSNYCARKLGLRLFSA